MFAFGQKLRSSSAHSPSPKPASRRQAPPLPVSPLPAFDFSRTPIMPPVAAPSAALLQPKLRVGASNDPLEQEAERTAERVMSMQPSALPERAPPSLQSSDTARRALPRTAAIAGEGAPVQRSCDVCEEQKKRDEEANDGARERIQRQVNPDANDEWDEDEDAPLQGTLQAKARSDASPMLGRDAEAAIQAARTGGQPLSAAERAFFEPRFGHDFSRVRIHAGSSAAAAARVVDAHAFALGSDIVFGAGQYAPSTHGGQRLLAHELAHVIQQGHAGAPTGSAAAASGVAESDAAQRASVIRRKPGDLSQEPTHRIKTPKGGNLRLRVKATPALMLKDPPDDCKGAAECVNSVGNVPSGATVVIREKLQYGWNVVEAETLEYGKRIGYVHNDYLVPISAIPEGAYDEKRGLCIDPGKCEQPRADSPNEEPEHVTPEEQMDTPSFGVGDAAFEAMEEEGGEPIEQYGVVQTDDGANLWPEANQNQPKRGLLSLNTKVFVERAVGDNWYSVYVEAHQRGGALPVASGTHGFVQASRVSIDMPDPDAWLHRITKDGQGALALAAELYPDAKPDCKAAGHACRDHRYLVNVLVAVNEAKQRKFLYKEKPSDSWADAKTMKASQGSGGKLVGGQVWVPGKALVDAMHDQVSSGSITLEALATMGDIAIGVGAFIVGLLHGALMSVADIFIGIYDLIKLAGELVEKLFRGTLIADAQALWEDIKKIKASEIIELVGAKWNHPNVWDRWKFRGYVIGYAIVEILMMFFSGGIVTAVKGAAKAGKVGKFAKYLSELGAVKKLVTAAEALKGKAVDKLRAALKAAEAISDAHGWAAQALRLPLSILRRLTEVDIGKLRKLPQWARERFSMLADSVKLRLLGCSSPCVVDVDAIAKALKLAGTGGTKLLRPDDVLDVLKKIDANFKTAKISRKLRKADSALMAAIKEAGLTDADFAKLADFITPGDLSNAAQSYKTFARYVTSVVPAKTGPDIKRINRIAAAMVKAEPRRGAALKGAIFEQWVALHVPELASRSFGRITFDLKALIKKTFPPYKRHVDKWVPSKGEIWDMKHYVGKVPTGQADDYLALLGKVAPDGKTVKTVNYLFPNKAVAEMNKHLATTYGFSVHYIDDVTQKLVKLF